VAWLRDWVSGGTSAPEGLRVIRGRSEDNTAIDPAVFRRMRATLTARQARQELDAEILTDIDGALWTFALIHDHRIHVDDGQRIPDDMPDLVRVVVGVDPPATSTGDECGIVVVGIDRAGHLWILDDRSIPTPTP